MDNTLTTIIIIYACGLLSMIAELFLPGAIIGTLGFCATTGSVIYAFVNGYTTTGTILVFVTLAYIPLFFFMWKNVAAKFMAVSGDEKDFKSGTLVNDSLMGKEGETATSLHPTGIARIDGKRYDVVTRGEMLDKGVRVEVIDTSGNRVVVKKVGAS